MCVPHVVRRPCDPGSFCVSLAVWPVPFTNRLVGLLSCAEQVVRKRFGVKPALSDDPLENVDDAQDS